MKFQISDIYLIFYFLSVISWLTILNLEYKVKLSKNFKNKDLGIEFKKIAENKLYFRTTLASTLFYLGSIITFLIMLIGHVLFSLNINTIITADILNAFATTGANSLSKLKIIVFALGAFLSLFILNEYDFEYFVFNKNNKYYKKFSEKNYIKQVKKNIEKSLEKSLEKNFEKSFNKNKRKNII